MKHLISTESRDVKNFDADYRELISFVNTASHTRQDRPPGCSPNLNAYLWDLDPLPDQKLNIAKIRHPNFNNLEELDQNEILDGIEKFSLIPKICAIRFRSTLESLKSLAEAQPIISTLEFSEKKEAFLVNPSPNFELCRGLIRVLQIPASKLDISEKDQPFMADYVTHFVEILEETLKPVTINNKE